MEHLSFVFGSKSEWFWLMLQSITLVITLIFVNRQVRHMRDANMLQALAALDERWKSKEFRNYRVAACQRYGDGELRIARLEGEVLSFFESLGVYLRRGVFDREILWEKYSYYVERYWILFKDHVDEFRTKSCDNTWYDQFEYLNKEMSKCARQRRITDYGRKTQQDMKTFVRGETEGIAATFSPIT
jgi:hypothetical protein